MVIINFIYIKEDKATRTAEIIYIKKVKVTRTVKEIIGDKK